MAHRRPSCDRVVLHTSKRYTSFSTLLYAIERHVVAWSRDLELVCRGLARRGGRLTSPHLDVWVDNLRGALREDMTTPVTIYLEGPSSREEYNDNCLAAAKDLEPRY